jgi:plastocyanin
MRLLVGVVVLAATASAAAPLAAGLGEAADALLRMDDYVFQPLFPRVPPGGSIRVVNDGDEPHSFTSAKNRTLFHLVLQPGEAETVVAPLVEASYPFYCVFHATPETEPGEGMAGVLRVTNETAASDGKRDVFPIPAPSAGTLVAAAAGLLVFARRPRPDKP